MNSQWLGIGELQCVELIPLELPNSYGKDDKPKILSAAANVQHNPFAI